MGRHRSVGAAKVCRSLLFGSSFRHRIFVLPRQIRMNTLGWMMACASRCTAWKCFMAEHESTAHTVCQYNNNSGLESGPHHAWVMIEWKTFEPPRKQCEARGGGVHNLWLRPTIIAGLIKMSVRKMGNHRAKRWKMPFYLALFDSFAGTKTVLIHDDTMRACCAGWLLIFRVASRRAVPVMKWLKLKWNYSCRRSSGIRVCAGGTIKYLKCIRTCLHVLNRYFHKAPTHRRIVEWLSSQLVRVCCMYVNVSSPAIAVCPTLRVNRYPCSAQYAFRWNKWCSFNYSSSKTGRTFGLRARVSCAREWEVYIVVVHGEHLMSIICYAYA